MRAAPGTRAFYLSDGAEQIFALWHPAALSARRDSAVLICPPFGWDDVCSYRSRREWAVGLASAGFPTLRIDLPSTGDSSGSPEDQGRLVAWKDAVGAAATWLGAESGCERVTAIGIGLGGMLICATVAEGAPIDEAVLWAVPARGAALVRELRAFERMESARFGKRRNGVTPQPSGAVRAGGFRLAAETVQSLSELDLAEAFPHGRLRRVLLLERDGIRADARLRESLERAGTQVRVAPGRGYGAMMAEPQESRPPTEVFALVERWLEERAQPGSQPSHSRPAERRPGLGVRHAPRPRQPVAARGVAQLGGDGGGVRETPIFIEQSFGGMFGVLAEPTAEGREPAELGALLLNAGAIRRIGPNRMWVEIARRWAAQGVPTLRLDLEGLGDADGDASRFSDVAELYVPQFVTQVRAAIDALQTRGTARRFVLAGLCSGAYWSFHGALQDDRVAAAFMLNPRTLFWDAAAENIRYLRRGLLKPSSWHLIARGEVGLARVGQVARRAPQSLLASAIGRWQARGELDQLELALDQLSAGGKQLAFVFSEEEPLHEELERQGRLGKSERWPNLELELLPGRDHTLRPLYSQRGAHDALDRALQRQRERLLR